MELEILVADQWRTLRDIRLRALKDSPAAQGESQPLNDGARRSEIQLRSRNERVARSKDTGLIP